MESTPVSLPDGIVTFLFTDIEGSTRLWELEPHAMRAALARHDAILKGSIEEHQGYIFRTGGDAFNAVFVSASDAVDAAVAMQRGLNAEAWPTETALRVRVVIHTTAAELKSGDYVSPGLNLVGRLLDVCHGNQVLITQTTEQLLRGQLDGVMLQDLGMHYFRDLLKTYRIFQLNIPGLPAAFPPLKSLAGIPNNLPVQTTSFVGREDEVAELIGMLVESVNTPRLITLVGPGGTGKTRLSLQAAAETLNHFADGVWLVELAPISDPQLVTQTVISTLSLQEPVGRSPEAFLIDYLRRQKLLLILDNCEHLIDECARLADVMIHACPNLWIIASSREALGIAGERVYRVRSLQLPPDHTQLSAEAMCDFAAIRLFLDRAVAVQPDFTLTADNCVAILNICQRLDGIPLAIELAAARTRVLSPQQIADRLDNRFRLLTGGSRTALPRQRTLQALIDWSYDLLSEPECVLLRRLSVFSGGWSLEAAEQVCGDHPQQKTDVYLPETDILDLLDQLVGKSLVVAEDSDLGMRYHLLETIRQYAQEKLVESGEADTIRNRHLAYFVEMVRQAKEAFYKLHGLQGWVNRLKLNADNLRAARAWALEHDLRAAMELAGAVTIRWSAVEHVLEIHQFIETVRKQAEADPAFGPDGSPEDRRLFAATLFGACIVTFGLGQSQKSQQLGLRAVEIAREVGDLITLSSALGLVAAVSSVLGEFEKAIEYTAESQEIAEKGGNRLGLAMSLTSSIPLFAAAQGGEQERAWANWQKGMTMFRQGEEYWAQALGHQVAAITLLNQGDLEKAQDHAELALVSYEALGDTHFARIPRSILAELALLRGDFDQAENKFLELLPSWRHSGNIGALARVLELLAFTYKARAQEVARPASVEHLERATTLMAAATNIRSTYDTAMIPQERREYDATFAALREQLGEAMFAAAWNQGEAMGLDEAVDWAFDNHGVKTSSDLMPGSL